MKMRLVYICIFVILTLSCLGGCRYSEGPSQPSDTMPFADNTTRNYSRDLIVSLTPENVASAPKEAYPFAIDFRIWHVPLEEGTNDYLVCNVGIYNMSDNPVEDVFVEVFYHENIRENMLNPEIKSVKSTLSRSGSKGDGAVLSSSHLVYKPEYMTQNDAKIFEDEWDHVTLVIHYDGEEMQVEMTSDDIFWSDERPRSYANSDRVWFDLGKKLSLIENDEGKVMATVNGVEINSIDLKQIEQNYTFIAQQNRTKPLSQTEVLERAIQREVYYQEAQRLGYVIPSSDGIKKICANWENTENAANDILGPEDVRKNAVEVLKSLEDYIDGLGMDKEEYFNIAGEALARTMSIDKLLNNYLEQYFREEGISPELHRELYGDPDKLEEIHKKCYENILSSGFYKIEYGDK